MADIFDRLANEPQREPDMFDAIAAEQAEPKAPVQIGSFPERLGGALVKGFGSLGRGIAYLPVQARTEFMRISETSVPGPSYMPSGYVHKPPPAQKAIQKASGVVDKWYRNLLAKEDESLNRLIENHPEWYTEPPENFLDLISSPDKLAVAVAESTPLLVAAGAATMAGMPSVGAALVFAVEGQSAKDEALASGATEEEADQAYLMYGSVATALEMMQLKGFMKIGKKGYNTVLQKTASKLAKVKKLTPALIKTAAAEAVEEMGQGTWGEATAYLVYGKEPEGGVAAFVDRRAQEGLVAATMAGGSAGAGASWAHMTGGKKGGSAADVEKRAAEIAAVIESSPDLSEDQKTDAYNRLGQIIQQAKEVIADKPAAPPEAQLEAAETIIDAHEEARQNTAEYKQLEQEALSELAEQGDELAMWRIREMDKESVGQEKNLPAFEALFEQMVAGDEVAKTALMEGQYKGAREKAAKLEQPPTTERVLQKVYKKGFVARLTSIRNNADNIVAGAGSKKSQVKVMKAELAKIRDHYAGISQDIKANPELLAELGGINDLLPSYAAAIESFVKSPSKDGFDRIKTVGDQIAVLSNKYGARMDVTNRGSGRVDTAIPSTEKQLRNFATIKVHSLAKLLGVDKKARQKIQNDLIGQKSLKGMSLEEVKKVEGYFAAEAKKKGLTTSTGPELAQSIKANATQKSVQEDTAVPPAAWKEILQRPKAIVDHLLYQNKRIERLMEALDGFTEGPLYNSIWRVTFGASVNKRVSHTNRVGKFREALTDILAPELRTEEGLAEATEIIQSERAQQKAEKKEKKKVKKLTERAVRETVGLSLMAKYFTSGRTVVLEATATSPELALSASERIGVYLAMKNEVSRKHLLEGNLSAFDNPALAALEVVQKTSPKEIAIAEWILQDLADNFGRANQAAVIGLARELVEQDNYFMIRLLSTKELQTEDFLHLLENKSTREGVRPEPGETLTRVGGSQAIDLDAFGVYLNHLSRIEQFIHMAPVAKSVGDIINDRDFRQAINNVTAGHGAGIMERWLKNSVRGYAVDQGSGFGAKTLLWLKRKGVLFSLTGNLPSAARQAISGFNGVASHPTLLAYAAKHMTTSIDPRTFNALKKRMLDKSDMMRTRSFERELARIRDQAQAARVLTGKKEFSESALGFQRFMDGRTVTIVWNSSYDAALNSESIQKQFELDGSEEAALAFANKIAMRTQPMGDVEHLPDFFTGGPIESLLSTFQNQVNNNWNFWAHDIYGMRKAGKISNKMVAYRILASNILPAMLFGMISRGGLPKSWKDVLFDEVVYTLGPFFIIGRLVTDAMLGFAGGQTSVEDILPSSFSKTVGSALKAAGTEGEVRKKHLKKAGLYAIKTMGGITGLVPNQVIRTGQGIYDIITGEADDLRRLIYSDWSLTNYGWPGDDDKKTKLKR